MGKKSKDRPERSARSAEVRAGEISQVHAPQGAARGAEHASEATAQEATRHRARLARAKGPTRWALIAKIAGHNYKRSQLTRMAAALSYRTLFGLIPVMVVSLVVLHSFVDEAALRGVVKNVLEFTGITKISVNTQESVPEKGAAENRAGEIMFFGPPAPAQVLTTIQQGPLDPGAKAAASPSALAQSARLDELLSQLLDRIDKINFGAVGLVGVVLLIYAALAMIVEVEKSFNQILGDAAGKNWVRRVRDYWALLTLGPLLLVMSFGVREGAQRVAQQWADASRHTLVATEAVGAGVRSADGGAGIAQAQIPANTPSNSEIAPSLTDGASQSSAGWRGFIVASVAFVSTVLISALALVIVYTSIPNARVGVMPAIVGALIAAVLWETSKWAFTAYAGRSYSRLYGAIALLPLFMLWIYVTWIVVLLGFQVTALLQTFRSVSRRGVQQSLLIALGLADDPDATAGKAGVRIVDPASVLLVMCVVAKQFAEGRHTTRVQITDATGLDSDVVAELLARLVSMSLLHHVIVGAVGGGGIDPGSQAPRSAHESDAGQHDPSREAYALARPAEAIPAVEVLRVGEAVVSRDARRPAPMLDALTQAKARALEGRSLADLGAMLFFTEDSSRADPEFRGGARAVARA